MCPTLSWPRGMQPARILCLWNFPGKTTGVGCHFLLQFFFLKYHHKEWKQYIYIYCFYFSNWWVIALKCSVGSRCTTKQISHNYIYKIPLKSYSHIYWSSQSAGLGSLCYITAFHWKIKTRLHVHFFPFLILVFTFSVFGNFKLNIYTFKINSYLLINQSRQSILM